MTLDSCPAHRTPPENTFRRQNSWLGSKSGESQLKASKLAKDARRRRVELRRIRSFSQALSNADSAPNLVGMQKEATTEGTPMERGVRSSRSHGKISVVGRRREMDDAVEVELGFLKRSGGESYDFFGVFDGREGRRVARACSQMLPRMLAEIVEEESNTNKKEIDWEEVMIEGFHEVEAMMHENGAEAAALALIGSAAVVGDNEVVVAGSKAVLCRGGVAVRLLDVGENKAKGGEGEVRVRVAIRRRAGADDEFLILGSDGFWDVISDEVACQIAGRYCACGDGDDSVDDTGAEAAAALMAELAVAHGSKDNVSIILVDLRGAAVISDSSSV